MTLPLDMAAFNTYCARLPATRHVIQWGESEVWKVGEKVFAIGNWHGDGPIWGITFKVSKLSFEIMKEQPGLRPAPYLASRGMSWIQLHGDSSLSAEEVTAYLGESHRIVALGLTKRKRAELGLVDL